MLQTSNRDRASTDGHRPILGQADAFELGGCRLKSMAWLMQEMEPTTAVFQEYREGLCPIEMGHAGQITL